MSEERSGLWGCSSVGECLARYIQSPGFGSQEEQEQDNNDDNDFVSPFYVCILLIIMKSLEINVVQKYRSLEVGQYPMFMHQIQREAA